MHSKTVNFAQLQALVNAQIEQAIQEERLSGYISPKIIAEIYRLINQIIALSEDKYLDTDDPIYLYGLYTALLKLHKKHKAKQMVLRGRATNKTIGEIARLECLLDELKSQYYSYDKSTSACLDVIDMRNSFQRLLT